MIDPRTQWIIYKDRESNLLLYIEWKQRFAKEKQYTPAQPWYQQMAERLSWIVQRIRTGMRSVEKVTLTCCPGCVGSCPAR